MDWKAILGGISRHILTAGGGAAVTAGVASTDEITAIVGGLTALAGVLWSVFTKKKEV